MKLIPHGISYFRKIREKNLYYIDKTKIIEELMVDSGEVFLFTRPRRFGKTLMMTMLREFFDLHNDAKNLFLDLYIGSSDAFQYINKYPVLYFSFKDSSGNKESILYDMKSRIREEYNRYKEVKVSLEKEDLDDYNAVYRELCDYDEINPTKLKESICILSKAVSIHYNKKVILLIDEYDTPFLEAYTHHCYEDIRDFLGTLFSKALKDNIYLEKGILTGIQRVAKESIFSKLNNLKVRDVTSSSYNQYFGFTEKETKDMLEYYGLSLNKEVRTMYNGYSFSGIDIYNPWSIIEYCQDKELKSYWINTSTNGLIRDVIVERRNDSSFVKDFEELIVNESVEIALNLDANFFEVNSNEALWGLFVSAGYLTVKDHIYKDKYVLRIPNNEIRSEFERIVCAYGNLPKNDISNMMIALFIYNDYESFFHEYKRLVLNYTSYHDAKESMYHMLFLGMIISFASEFDVSSNQEMGLGRADIVLKSRNLGKNPNYVIEFKYGKNIDALSIQGIKQIETKQYDARLEGKIVYLSIAQNKKDCVMEVKEIMKN